MQKYTTHTGGNVLLRGNSKLGKTIWQFSIPAGSTCPGRSETCDTRCYAQHGFFSMPSVRNRLNENLKATKHRNFVDNVVNFINDKSIKTIRIHVAGDFYSLDYIRKWQQIVERTRHVQYFTYTRSWRDPAFRDLLTELGALPNMKMWWSTDLETGAPSSVPRHIRVAHMAITAEERPQRKADLVFLDHTARQGVTKYLNGIFVCPAENGVTTIQCEQCKFCFNGERKSPKRTSTGKTTTRVALDVVF